MMIAMVLRIPMTVDVPIIKTLAVSADLLNIIQEEHFGLQMSPLIKKSSSHTKLIFVLSL